MLLNVEKTKARSIQTHFKFFIVSILKRRNNHVIDLKENNDCILYAWPSFYHYIERCWLHGPLHQMKLASCWSHVGCYFLPGRIVVKPFFLSCGLLVFKGGGGNVILFIYIFFFFIMLRGKGFRLGIFNTGKWWWKDGCISVWDTI